jgi:hypothetical protein
MKKHNEGGYRCANNRPTRRMSYCVLLLAWLLAPGANAANINVKSSPSGQTLFPEQQFDLECWQEGNKIIDEKALNTMTAAPELNDGLISFKQGKDDGRQLILVTIGRSLCMAKTSPH